jgi:hypothetical protein
MPQKFRTAFFAYPAQPKQLSETIKAATDRARTAESKIELKLWPEMDVFGTGLADEVRSDIRATDVLVCDITKANTNVYYETGYAIGCGKPIAPVVNISFADARKEIQRDGLFDGIGYREYENSLQLQQILDDLPNHVLLELYGKPLNTAQPIYILDTLRKTDFRNSIISAIKASNVFFRSFDPTEIPRFSTISVIAEATSSAGLIIPLLASHIEDSARHNLRAAFLAGIAHGLGRETALFQKDFELVSADYRDFVYSVSNEKDIYEQIGEFAKRALLAIQYIHNNKRRSRRTKLQKLTLGASSAENEFRTLENYFVETAEYSRVIRGEARIVAGRKGSGKTAIFFQARDFFRSSRNTLVTDLKPESHQLSLFREELLRISNIGIFDHTIAAFWYLVIVSEVLLTICDMYDFRAKRDHRAVGVSNEIRSVLERFGVVASGDFTSRINRLGKLVVDEIKRLSINGGALSPERLTGIVFRGGIAELRALADKYAETSIVFLFDNIDKGWPSEGINEFDIRLVRLLIESLDKIRHDFGTQHKEFMSVVFLRNDIYELLVNQTPDRGKSGQIRIDWTDRAKLRQVIFRRLLSSTGSETDSFEGLWGKYFVSKIANQDSFEYMIDHCLMRPRFLINIIEYAIANAINRGHDLVQESDCVSAVRQHSLYLINDFGYEIRDVSGLPSEILYALVNSPNLLTYDEVISRFSKYNVSEKDLGKAFKLMLWYGVIGIALGGGNENFIYDYDYDMKRLEAEIRNNLDEPLYVINPALRVGLKS